MLKSIQLNMTTQICTAGTLGPAIDMRTGVRQGSVRVRPCIEFTLLSLCENGDDVVTFSNYSLVFLCLPVMITFFVDQPVRCKVLIDTSLLVTLFLQMARCFGATTGTLFNAELKFCRGFEGFWS